MIKIISFISFVGALIWTWCMLNTPAQMSIDVHAGIQSKLTLLIEESIKAKKPNMSQFTLNKMYTEKLSDNQVKAYFSYQYNDTLDSETTTQKISGEAILNKALSEDPLLQKWVIQSVKTDNEALDFKEGLTISANESEESTPDSTATAPTTTDQPASAPAQTIEEKK